MALWKILPIESSLMSNIWNKKSFLIPNIRNLPFLLIWQIYFKNLNSFLLLLSYCRMIGSIVTSTSTKSWWKILSFTCTSGKWILIHLIHKVALTSNNWLHCYRLAINVASTLKLKFNFQTCSLLLNNAFTILLVTATIISQLLSLKI